jgi:isoleucyl-tRNA synthetase
VLTEAQVLQAIQGLLKQHGSDVWFQRQARELLPQGYRCPRCGAREFEKETDILDVWFDSGASHAAVLKKRLGHWPAELYLEGSDQHRGWFQSSLICAVGTSDRAPFKEVLTHGFVVDGQGRKMSKSLGNVVAPEDVIKARGAEVLRLWVSAEQYRADIRLSEEILARLTEAYRKLRNTARFLLGNLYDFDGGDYSPHLWEIDRWALSRLQGLIRDVDAAYQRYEFHEVYHRLYNFCVLDMSAFYLDILKDRLYTFAKDSEARRAAQWSLRKILLAMARLMAPVLSFTAEEIWSHMQGPKEESVFLAPFPQVEEELLQPELEARWQALIEVRQEVNRALEHARRQRLVGNSLEAKVLLYAQGELLGLLQAYRKDLPMLFIVSQVELKEGPAPQEALQAAEVEGLAVLLRRAEGRKCLRCWNWSPTVGANPEAPELCSRCQEVVP